MWNLHVGLVSQKMGTIDHVQGSWNAWDFEEEESSMFQASTSAIVTFWIPA